MLNILFKIYAMLGGRERRNVIIVLLLILCTGLLEAVGVSSIIPFMSVLTNPEVINQTEYLNYFYDILHFKSINSFLAFLGVVVFVFIIVGLIFKSLTQYAIARFTHMRSCSLSSKLLGRYLYRPYSWFLNRHSSELEKIVLSEVQDVVSGVLLPVLQLIAQLFITICLFCVVVLVSAKIAFFSMILFGSFYFVIYFNLRKYLAKIGTELVLSNKERFQVAQEAFGGIKEIKAGGLENGYLQCFTKSSYTLARCRALSATLGLLPRYALEGLAIGGMLAIIITLIVYNKKTLDNLLPILGVFAFAGMRLLPAIQLIYQSAAKIRFNTPALNNLYKNLFEEDNLSKTDVQKVKSVKHIRMFEQLELRKLTYFYPKTAKASLRDIDITIKANSIVGFVGSTGAGKTTLVDVMLGLLPPSQGTMVIDGTEINKENVLGWQKSIGYVPQSIFLIDDTVAANIAFGVAKEEIDFNKVERAAKIAEIHEFIVTDLPDSYMTKIGERGIRISGGQRQRIGIARALYNDPDMLILDEATSALDNLTEKIIMDAVKKLKNKKTIIIIAHRLSSIMTCDCLYYLERGRVITHGTYNELQNKNNAFKKMTKSII